MASLNRLVKSLFAVKDAIFESLDMRDGDKGLSFHVNVRLRKGDGLRCPICGRKCACYDTAPRSRAWRTNNSLCAQVFLHAKLRRVFCPEHGVHTERVPWAAHKARHTRSFDIEAAWLARNMSRKAVSQFLRIDWETVMACAARVCREIEPDPRSRYEGLVRIGIDETSYRKGHTYITVVVNHDTNSVVWVGDGVGKQVLSNFFEELTPAQRQSIQAVSGDGAKWITDCVREYLGPGVKRCVDPFHVVQWATEAVDELRREAWRKAVKQAESKKKKAQAGMLPGLSGSDLRKAKKEAADARREASDIKHSVRLLAMSQKDMTPPQRLKLQMIAASDKDLYKGYLLKEELRMLLKLDDVTDVSKGLGSWVSRAARSGVACLARLADKVARHAPHIFNTVQHRLTNARIEATNNKIKLLIRRSYGFRNLNNLIDTVKLFCSNIVIPLPHRLSP